MSELDVEKLSDAQQRLVRFMAEKNTTADMQTGVTTGINFGLAGHDWDQLYGRSPSTATVHALVERGWLIKAEKQGAPWRQVEYRLTDEALALFAPKDPVLLWKLINMSDDYTFQGTYRVAAAVVLVIGRGQFGGEEIGGDHEIPILAFGGGDEWVQDEFGAEDLGNFFKSIDNIEIAECLETFVIGNETDRENYMTGLGDMTGARAAAYWSSWHDEHRSSMNDIGATAMQLAGALRATEEGEEIDVGEDGNAEIPD